MARRIKLSTPREIRQALSRVANMALNGELEPKQANVVIYAANAILGTIRTDEQQRKIDELEKAIYGDKTPRS